MKPPPKTDNGFSLIELLASLAIVAILAVILIPAIGKVRERAHVTKSLSNLRQIGTAIQLYTNEHNGQLPNKTASGSSTIIREDLIDPYLDSDSETWICPILKELDQSALPSDKQGHFTYSWRLTNFTDGWRDQTNAININNIITPSNAMVIANLSVGMRGGYFNGYAHVLMADWSTQRIPDQTYLGGNVNSIRGVNRLYLQTSGGKIRGYDY